MRQGDAIIKAREILGPSARLYAVYNPMDCYVDLGLNELTVAGPAESWEELLVLAKATEQATAWNVKQTDEGNNLTNALYHLRETTKAFLKDSKFMGLLSKKETRLVVGGLKANQ